MLNIYISVLDLHNVSIKSDANTIWCFLKGRSSYLSPPLSPSWAITVWSVLDVVLPNMLWTAMLIDARSIPPQLQTRSLQGRHVSRIKILILKKSPHSVCLYNILCDWLYNGLLTSSCKLQLQLIKSSISVCPLHPPPPTTTLTLLSCFSAPCGQIWACEDTIW